MMRDRKKKLLILLLVLVSSVLLVAGWIFLNRAERLAYVDLAIGSLRVLVNSEAKFAATQPDIGYVCTLAALPNDDLTAELVKSSRRNEYAFEISCPAQDVKQPSTKYQLTARPLLRGMLAFCSYQTGVVKYDETGSIDKCLESGVPL